MRALRQSFSWLNWDLRRVKLHEEKKYPSTRKIFVVYFSGFDTQGKNYYYKVR